MHTSHAPFTSIVHRSLLALTTLLTMSHLAEAHPGHGPHMIEGTVWHQLLLPQHSLPVTLSVAFAGVCMAIFARHQPARVFGGALATFAVVVSFVLVG